MYSNDSPVHPWAQLLYDDLLLLRPITGGEDLLAAMKGNIHNLLWDDHVRHLFLGLVPRELAACFFLVL